MIKILNPTRLTRQPLFEKLINYLDRSLHGGMYQGGLHSAGE